jgi:hypothetical protein
MFRKKQSENIFLWKIQKYGKLASEIFFTILLIRWWSVFWEQFLLWGKHTFPLFPRLPIANGMTKYQNIVQFTNMIALSTEWPDECEKSRPKCSPIHFWSQWMHNLNRYRNSPKMWLLLWLKNDQSKEPPNGQKFAQSGHPNYLQYCSFATLPGYNITALKLFQCM